MFAWLASLLLLFANHGNAMAVSSAGLNSVGDRHMQPADNPQPDPSAPPVVDGGTGKGGGN